MCIYIEREKERERERERDSMYHLRLSSSVGRLGGQLKCPGIQMCTSKGIRRRGIVSADEPDAGERRRSGGQ